MELIPPTIGKHINVFFIKPTLKKSVDTCAYVMKVFPKIYFFIELFVNF